MDTVPTLLFGRNKLFREGLKSLLKGSQFNVIGESDDVGMMDFPEDIEPGLILIDLSSNPVHIVDDLHHLGSVFADSPVVILNDNLCSNTLASCLAAGAAGYLMKDISLDALLISLQLVVLGEKVFPTHLAALLVNGVANTVPANIPPDNSFGLSEREMQILQCLVQGDSNKLIANRLSITEATVKVHMKSLLRKINVSNRTQAAIWALNNGLLPNAGALPSNPDSSSSR
ncbi:MAG: response regulator [Alphaproteobacteria bacterium]|nr:response regulator [Alphaproteobacteria bacterium]